MTKRDDFPKQVIRNLQDRVGSRCSRPDCRVPTTGPRMKDEGVSRIGKAAHITAAAKLGPRFDKNLTREARRSFANGIWLCSIHADEVDSDEARFPVPLLRDWKAQAESAATLERGKRLPSESDVIGTVAMALGKAKPEYIPFAPKSVHLATEEALQQLDPRFQVVSSYQRGVTEFQLLARESVTLRFSVDLHRAPDFQAKYRDFVKHGRSIQIDAQAVSVSGSPLIAQIATQSGLASGKFEVVPHGVDAKQRMWSEKKDSGERTYFDDIDGFITAGTESFRFDGRGWGGLLSSSMSKPLDPSQTASTSIFKTHLESWDGRDIRNLPFLDKLLAFVSCLVAGETLHMSLEINGLSLLSAQTTQLAADEWTRSLLTLFAYTSSARTLCRALDIYVKFDSTADVRLKDYEELDKMVLIATNTACYSHNEVERNPTMTITLGENARMLADCGGSMSVMVARQPSPTLKIFSDEITLPHQRIVMSDVSVRTDADTRTLKPGDSVVVELVRLENFQLLIAFESESDTFDGAD